MEVVLLDHRPDDLAAVRAWAGDRAVTQALTFGPLDRSGCEEWLEAAVAEAAAPHRRRWSRAVVTDDRVVGVVVISEDSREHGRAEIGFAIRRSCWGNGVGTRAVASGADMALGELGFHRVWAVCDPDNERAQRVLARCGFTEEGRLRSDLRIAGEWRDSLVFGRLRTDRLPDA